jgi:hypothetical protein
MCRRQLPQLAQYQLMQQSTKVPDLVVAVDFSKSVSTSLGIWFHTIPLLRKKQFPYSLDLNNAYSFAFRLSHFNKIKLALLLIKTAMVFPVFYRGKRPFLLWHFHLLIEI